MYKKLALELREVALLADKVSSVLVLSREKLTETRKLTLYSLIIT